jgi:hypothetical protein
MLRMRCNPLDRLRTSKLLHALLLLLALASAVSGFQAAVHLVEAGDHSALTAPPSQDPDDGSTAHRLDCPGCRLLGTWAFAFPPDMGWGGHEAPAQGPSSSFTATGLVVDLVARWHRQLKHGPPPLSR